jgi:hypothetical protein
MFRKKKQSEESAEPAKVEAVLAVPRIVPPPKIQGRRSRLGKNRQGKRFQ